MIKDGAERSAEKYTEEQRKKISIIVIRTTDGYKAALGSILKQKNFNLADAEVIIADSSEKPVSENKLDEYRKNISLVYEYAPESSKAELYNLALRRAKGDIVNFITGDAFYSSENVLSCGALAQKDCAVIVNTGYYDRDTKKLTPYPVQPEKSGKYNLCETPYMISMNLLGYFVDYETAAKTGFCPGYRDECDMKFILDYLREGNNFRYFEEAKITSYSPFENNTSKCAVQYKPEWYQESLDRYLEEVSSQKEIPLCLQEAIMYLVFAKINCNLQDRTKGVVAKEDFEELSEKIFRVISCLDDRIITQNYNAAGAKEHLFKVPRWIRMYLIRNKYRVLGLELETRIKDGILFYVALRDGEEISSTPVAQLCEEKVTVYAINKKDGKLYMDCSTTLVDCIDKDSLNIYASIGKDGKARRLEIKESGIYPLMRIFGKTIAKKYRFIIELDTDEIAYSDKLCVYAGYNGEEIKHKFGFSTVYSRLSDFENSFWHTGKFLLVNKNDCIVFEKAGAGRIFAREIRFDITAVRSGGRELLSPLGVKIAVLILFRWLYYITRPFYKNKHIWITWDKLYKAGDNGEYMYQYCRKNKKTNIYYMLKKDSPDYERMVAEDRKHILLFKSFKARFIALHSEVILNTHANIVSSCGFDFMAKPYVAGIFNPEVICIQHGLTIQRIAQYQNRLFDNIKLYCCASPMEVQNILGEMYGYAPEDVKLTGLARYDGLKSNDKKIILITPTWRRNVVNSSVAHIKKSHNDNFKNSEYFRIYNSLINNKELISCADRTGYKIIYLLHPAMSGQLEDFDRNEAVDIIPATGDINYEKILTEASLMVTDYSGVQFDFAYQRKPLVYYHPDTLPPHYDAGLLDYETMAFGPVCKNEGQIVAELCDYMKNSCVIKEKYKLNADNFFAFDDFANCERIYNEVISYLKEIKRI